MPQLNKVKFTSVLHSNILNFARLNSTLNNFDAIGSVSNLSESAKNMFAKSNDELDKLSPFE